MRRPPKDTPETARKLTRRALVLGAAQTGVVGVIGWRLHQMQIARADEFRLLAEENRINLRLIPPARGLVLDKNGVPLAVNEQVYRIVMVREDAGDVEDALARLDALIPLDEETLARARGTRPP